MHVMVCGEPKYTCLLGYCSSRSWENLPFAYAIIKAQISCAVTVQLISAFVFATTIVHPLNFLNPKFQASNHLLLLYSPICVGPGQKHQRQVSHDVAHVLP